MIKKIKKIFGIVTEKDMVEQIKDVTCEMCKIQIEEVRKEIKELKG